MSLSKTEKKAIDKDGNIVVVPIETPCHASNKGQLPIIIDAVKDKSVLDEMETRKQIWEAEKGKLQALENIEKLESQITKRRIREAILNIDNGWLIAHEALIAEERKKLQGL